MPIDLKLKFDKIIPTFVKLIIPVLVSYF